MLLLAQATDAAGAAGSVGGHVEGWDGRDSPPALRVVTSPPHPTQTAAESIRVKPGSEMVPPEESSSVVVSHEAQSPSLYLYLCIFVSP